MEIVQLHAATLEIILMVLFLQHNEQNSGPNATSFGGMGDRFIKKGATGMDSNYSLNK